MEKHTKTFKIIIFYHKKLCKHSIIYVFRFEIIFFVFRFTTDISTFGPDVQRKFNAIFFHFLENVKSRTFSFEFDQKTHSCNF